MQLRSLKVRNIRSYENAELTFGAGTTLVSGDVGSGKTSLLYAIEMALFGFAEVDPVYLIRHRARQAEVTLGLADDAHTYELRRRFSRKSRGGREVFEPDECVYGKDGAITKYSATELRQRAIELLGFPDNPNARAHSDLWRWAVYVPQERMRAVLDQRADERRETVRKALGLEQYKTAGDNAQLLGRDIVVRARSLEERAEGFSHFDIELPKFAAERDRTLLELDRLAALEPALQAERESADATVRSAEEAARAEAVDRAKLADIEPELRHVGQRRETLEGRLRELLRRTESLARDEGTIGRLIERRPEVEAERSSVGKRLEELRAEGVRAEARQRELEAAVQEVDLRQAAEVRAASALAEARTEVEAATKRLAERRADHPRDPPTAPGSESVEEIDRRLSALRDRADRAGAELATLRHLLEDADALLSSGSCPRCHQRVDASSFTAHREEAVRAVADGEARWRLERSEVDRAAGARSAREQYDRSQEAWKHVEELRASARTNLTEAEQRCARAVEGQAQAARFAEEATAHLARVRATHAVPIGEIGVDLGKTRERLAELEAAVQEIAIGVDRLESIRRQRSEISDERARLGVEMDELLATDHGLRDRQAELTRRLLGRNAGGELESARLTVRAAIEKVERLRREMTRLETEGAHASGRVAEAEAGRRRKSELLRSAAGERQLAEFLQGPFRTEIQLLEQRLLARAQLEFERVFSRAFQTLVEDPRIAARTDGAFTPAVEIDGEWTPPEALSGGERTALALSFRIALGAVVRSAGRLRLETLILDEPTDGFSPEQVLRMGELLEELALPQVILVSHEAGLASIADRVIKVGKDSGVSVLTPDAPAAPPRAETAEPTARGDPPEHLVAR
jgi:exonuclease SbcC